MKSSRPRTKRLAINCPENCGFAIRAIGPEKAEALKKIAETGVGYIVFAREATPILGREPAPASVSRHLKHYVEIEADDPIEVGPKPSDIEILDSIIVSGFRNSRNWKPTIRDTLEAMKLKVQMTGNSAFDDLIALFDADEDEDGLPEDPQAVLSPEEVPDDHDEDLEEPLVGE